MSGRNPPSYCTLTLIAMQGHQQKGRQNSTSSNNKDKSNTKIETSTAEDHDDENLHNPETVQDAVIHLEVDEEQWAITQGSKRQARWVWSPRTMSGLRLPDTPHGSCLFRSISQERKASKNTTFRRSCRKIPSQAGNLSRKLYPGTQV